MGKKKEILVSDQYLKEIIYDELHELQLLCARYDAGEIRVAFKMATACSNILTGGDGTGHKDKNHIVRVLRNKFRFRSVKDPETGSPGKVTLPLVSTKLVQFTYCTMPPSVDFLPLLDCCSDSEHIYLSFVEWWSRDIIYRTIDDPLTKRFRVISASPYKEKLLQKSSYTRLAFVWDMRNFRGAHFDGKINEDLAILLGPSGFNFDFVVELKTGETLSVHDGTLPLRTPAASAMMRQISHEVLNAYDSINSVHPPSHSRLENR